ncbi:MAG: 4-diphosphocytidyl-2-C-methyl-D-erythritol kinase [Pseudomonadota bacterium]
MKSWRFLAPAKLNLFLHVLGRRADGYHDLQTVFQLVDLCDTVDIVVTDDGLICRDPPPEDSLLAALPEDRDLVIRAARLLQVDSGCRQGARIHVAKRIPAGGGLGGGSSDAATVLLALDRLWGLGYGRERLAALGLQLGADVPVFVMGRNAWAEGRGERLTPVELPPRWFLIVKPAVAVGTAEIFNAPELTRDTPPITLRAFRDGAGRNDCEPVVRHRYPAVAAALDWLACHAPARLTGTGSCGFAAFDSEAAAWRAAADAPAGLVVFVARGIAQSSS